MYVTRSNGVMRLVTGASGKDQCINSVGDGSMTYQPCQTPVLVGQTRQPPGRLPAQAGEVRALPRQVCASPETARSPPGLFARNNKPSSGGIRMLPRQVSSSPHPANRSPGHFAHDTKPLSGEIRTLPRQVSSSPQPANRSPGYFVQNTKPSSGEIRTLPGQVSSSPEPARRSPGVFAKNLKQSSGEIGKLPRQVNPSPAPTSQSPGHFPRNTKPSSGEITMLPRQMNSPPEPARSSPGLFTKNTKPFRTITQVSAKEASPSGMLTRSVSTTSIDSCVRPPTEPTSSWEPTKPAVGQMRMMPKKIYSSSEHLFRYQPPMMPPFFGFGDPELSATPVKPVRRKFLKQGNSVERARVLFTYVAENNDELSIVEGDIVNVLEKELEDSGWWKGELNGKVGVFPDNFVDILPAEEAKGKKPLVPSLAKPGPPEPGAQRPAHLLTDLTPKPEEKEKKVAPALPSKKPAMPPPPISKKPVPPKQPDLIAQTDDHKVKESQKEASLATVVRPSDVAPPTMGRMVGKLASAAPRPVGRFVSPNVPKPLPQPVATTTPNSTTTTTTTANTTEEIDLDIVPSAEPLVHLNASRVKPPPKRLPSINNREEKKEDKEDPPPPGPAPPIPDLPDSPRRDAYARRAHRRAQQRADVQQKADQQQSKLAASCSAELLSAQPTTAEDDEKPAVSRPVVPRQPPVLPKNEPPLSPTQARSPVSLENNTEAAGHQVGPARTPSVTLEQHEALQREVTALREAVHKLDQLTTVLMNDIDEGAKERRSMQVEISRMRKLALLPGNPTL